MGITRVVHCQRETFDAYIGRVDWCPPGFTGPGSDGRFGNPFGGQGTIQRHRDWFLQRVQFDPAFRADVERLRGLRLGCWCGTRKSCHGDVIAEWLNGREDQRSEDEILAQLAAKLAGRPRG